MKRTTTTMMLLAAGLTAVACGTKKDSSPDVDVHVPPQGEPNLTTETVEPPKGVITIVDESYDEGKGKVGDTGVSVKRLRVWKRNPDSEFHSETGGDAPDLDLHTLELWFTLAGESHVRYRKVPGLRVDGDGWLFPGENLDNYLPHQDVAVPYRYYERQPSQAFILDEIPALLAYDRGSNIVLDATRKILQDGVVGRITMDLAKTELPAVRHYVWSSAANLLGGEAQRQIWVKNERTKDGFAMKGRMACVIETRNGGVSGNGDFNPVSVVYENVELGNLIHSTAGHIQASPATDHATCDSPRCGSYDGMDPVGDDELWVQVTETFHIAGVNIAADKRQIDIVRSASAPFYLNRELPVPFASRTPGISGIERLVRQCNDAAVQNAMSVAVNPLLGAATGAATGVAQYSILPTIGFRLLANGRADRPAPAGEVFASAFSQFCDAMPDMKSPSAGLNAAYSGLKKDQRGIVPGVDSCGDQIPLGSGIAADHAAKPLGLVLDRYIVPGGWSGELGRHTGVIIKTGADVPDRPVHRTQVRGGATLH